MAGTTIPAATKLAVGGDNNLLLPLLLMGGLGGSGNSGDSGSDMLMPLLLMTMMK